MVIHIVISSWYATVAFVDLCLEVRTVTSLGLQEAIPAGKWPVIIACSGENLDFDYTIGWNGKSTIHDVLTSYMVGEWEYCFGVE